MSAISYFEFFRKRYFSARSLYSFIAVIALLTITLLVAGANAAQAQDGSTASVTYSHGVAQVLQKNCVSCHNPSGGAPFNLLTYEDAKQWGGQILDVTQSRYMPPWLPLPDLHSAQAAHSFQGDRRLSDADLEAIRHWVSAGMPQGTALPTTTGPGSQLRPTEMASAMAINVPQVIHVPASGPDIFLTLAVPVPDGAAHQVSSMAVQVSDPQAAHSILIGMDEKRELRGESPDVLTAGLPGMELSVERTVRFALNGQLLLWTPDAPVLVAAGSPWTIAGGSDLILTAHIKPTGKAEDLTFKVLLSPGRGAHGSGHVLLHLEQDDALEIAAGDRQYVREAKLTLRQATTIAALYPRAHYAARSVQASAMLPDGSERTLLTIDKWDVDWVSVYRFARPLLLPKGTVVSMRFTYDNSSNNPHNPNDPPKKILSGHSSKDEVAELWLETSR